MLLAGITWNASPQVIPEAAGTWNNVAMSTPAFLRLDKDSSGRIVWIGGLTDFEIWNAALTVTADGQFTGPASGTFSIAGPGLIRATPAGGPSVDFAINSGHDFMVSAKSSSDGHQQDLELLLKAPNQLTEADLAGAWRGFNLITPSRLEAVSRENLVVGLDTIGRFLARTGSLTVSPDGTISGNVGGAFTGWITIGQAGAVFAHINEQPPDPPTTLRFVINAGLDILATAMPGGDGSQEILLFIRAPTAASNANLKGYWRSADFAVPPRLTLQTNSLGEAFSVQGARDFEFSHDVVSTGKNGEIIGLVEPFVGQVETRADGWVHVAGTNAYGALIAEDLWTNAGQNVLVRTRSHEQQELTLVLKAPTSPEAEAAASKLVCIRQNECLVVAWASDETRTLQQSSNLLDWTPVEGSSGQGCFEICPPLAEQVYYRVLSAQ